MYGRIYVVDHVDHKTNPEDIHVNPVDIWQRLRVYVNADYVKDIELPFKRSLLSDDMKPATDSDVIDFNKYKDRILEQYEAFKHKRSLKSIAQHFFLYEYNTHLEVFNICVTDSLHLIFTVPMLIADFGTYETGLPYSLKWEDPRYKILKISEHHIKHTTDGE